MKCHDIRQLTHVYVDGLLSEAQQSVIFNHLKTCDTCAASYGELFELKRELQALPRFEVPPTLIQRINRYRKKQMLVRWGSVGSLAAVLLVFVIVLVAGPKPSVPNDEVLAIYTPLQKTKHVHFLVRSEKAFENVEFSIRLPKNYQLEGYSHTALNWTGNLRKGNNLLKLPVFAAKSAKGYIELRIKTDNASKVIKVRVTT